MLGNADKIEARQLHVISYLRCVQVVRFYDFWIPVETRETANHNFVSRETFTHYTSATYLNSISTRSLTITRRSRLMVGHHYRYQRRLKLRDLRFKSLNLVFILHRNRNIIEAVHKFMFPKWVNFKAKGLSIVAHLLFW